MWGAEWWGVFSRVTDNVKYHHMNEEGSQMSDCWEVLIHVSSTASVLRQLPASFHFTISSALC